MATELVILLGLYFMHTPPAPLRGTMLTTTTTTRRLYCQSALSDWFSPKKRSRVEAENKKLQGNDTELLDLTALRACLAKLSDEKHIS